MKDFILKKFMKKITSITLAAIMCSAVAVNPDLSFAETQSGNLLSQVSDATAVASSVTRYTRRFNQWSYKTTDNELYEAGCGLISTGNAIYAMTGQTINMSELKKWAQGVKGWTASAGLYRHAYFSNMKSSYLTEQYGFTITGPADASEGITSNNKIIAERLKQGNVAVVAAVPNHYICITDYDAENNKYFVIEGAVYNGTDGRNLPAASWVSESKLSTGNTKIRNYTFLTFNNMSTTTTATTTAATTTTTVTTTTPKVIPMNQFKGKGTADDPYQISGKEELEKMRDYVNDADYCSHYANAYYVQTADIDLQNEEWLPIGVGRINGAYTYDNMFHGCYDGSEHYIRNLKIEKDNAISGLFGYVAGEYTDTKNRGYIHDIVVTGDLNSSQSVNIGGIAGRMVSGATIENCGFIGNVSGGNSSESEWSGAGGIVGCLYASGTITNCYHTGNVTSDTRAGGIAGLIRFYENNENTSTKITRCFHAGGTISGGTADGGIVAECMLYGKDNEVVIQDCYVSSDSGTEIKLLNTVLNDTKILKISEMKKLADVLGEPFVNNPQTSISDLNCGYPIFAWQKNAGDINNDNTVDITDAVILQDYILGKEELTEEQFLKADINNDGTTDIFDVVLIRKIITEK